jgi:tetratricopeptide (TPR) repeat protein
VTRLTPLLGAVLAALIVVAACKRPPPPPAVSTTSSGPAPTFNKDVAPILFERCAPCHRPGQGTPFTLLSYADVKPRSDKVAKATQSHHMPPWLPDPIEPAFAGERRLRDDQIAVIARWASAGAPEGDPRDLPAPPAFPEGWQLGQPDLVITPPRPFVLQPQDENVFRNLVVRVPLTADRFVRAVEFRPGTAPVHHAVVHLDRTAMSRRRDGADGQPGFDGMGAMGTQEPDGHFVGWAPGRGPILSAEGMPWRLDRGTDIVLELHLIPGKRPIAVQPALALYFAPAAPSTTPLMLRMGSKAIDIPAGARDYAITDTYQLPVDVDLLSVYPHAHFLGREMQVIATLPDGAARPLLRIRHWSFHWQQDYRYVRPVPLPRGTTIAMRFTYDNSDENDDNPRHPPVNVTAGQRSTDEMGNLLLQVVPHSIADRARLVRDFAWREVLANVAGAEMLVRHNPDNAENQVFLGSSYVDAGRLADGIPHLEYGLRLDPRSAKAHNELGGALMKQSRLPEALAQFRQAVALAPRDDRMIYNLGKALVALGQPAEAAREFERALAVNPDLAEAHDELGVLLFSRGRVPEAVARLKRAVELAPDSAIFRSDLGGALAEMGKTDEALQHLRRALEIDPDYAPARENLARLGKSKI